MTQYEHALDVVRKWLQPIGPAVLLTDRLITEAFTGLDCVIACFVSQGQLRVFVSQPAFRNYLSPKSATAVGSWEELAEKVSTILRAVAAEDTREFLVVDPAAKVGFVDVLQKCLVGTEWVAKIAKPHYMAALKAELGLLSAFP